MATPEQQAHTAKLLDAYRRRLERRELQKAELGVSADPVIDLEIDDLRASIATLEQHVEPPKFGTAAQRAIRNQYDSDLDFLMADGAARNRRQTRLEEQQASLATQVHQLNQTVLVLVDDEQQDKAAGESGRRRNYWLLLLSIGLSALALALVAALVIRFVWR